MAIYKRDYVCFQQNTRDEVRKINGDGSIAGALAANTGMKQQNYIACLTPEAPQTHRVYGDDAAWPSICANTGKAGQNQQAVLKQKGNTVKAEVRRLTPTECERLMGFPDNYTAVMGAESARYAACGNSWASPCARFVIKGIRKSDTRIDGQRRTFKYGTISSGVECHTLASKGLGDEAVFFSEIAPAPVGLLKTHYPDVPILGDMTRVDYDQEKGVIHNAKYEGYELMDEKILGFKPVDAEYREIPCKYGEVDLVSGGTPCTDCSVAGKRQGAEEGSGTRSALAYQLPRIGAAVGSRWIMFENVAGIFSSNGGRDFLWLIHRMTDYGYTSIAWRTLDAQFVRTDTYPRAVPQRRRRVFLVGYRGFDWRIPCETLFEPMKALGLEPPTRTVGVGFDGRVCQSNVSKSSISSHDSSLSPSEVEPKSELEEFKEFVKSSDGRILCVLADRGVCIKASERMRELEEEERLAKASVGGGDDLFGGDLFGEPEEKNQGRGLKASDLELGLPGESSIRKVGEVGIFQWAKTVCQEVLFCGELFAGKNKKVGGESRSTEDEKPQIPLSTSTSSLLSSPTVDDLNPKLLANIGNAGFLSDGYCVTMKMPEWNAGVTEEELETMPKELADLYDGDVCGLSDILEDDVDPKYKLSWRACYGILNRAVKRGKKLPIELGYALVERIIDQAAFVKWQLENGKAEASADKLSEREVARNCYEAFVAFMKPVESVEAVDPKSVGADAGSEADDEGEDADDGASDPDSDEIAKIGNEV